MVNSSVLGDLETSSISASPRRLSPFCYPVTSSLRSRGGSFFLSLSGRPCRFWLPSVSHSRPHTDLIDSSTPPSLPSSFFALSHPLSPPLPGTSSTKIASRPRCHKRHSALSGLEISQKDVGSCLPLILNLICFILQCKTHSQLGPKVILPP